MPDLIGPTCSLLFCGINPGLYSAFTGYHFARPGNRFWKVLFLSGLTSRELRPDEGDLLLARGIGITNLVVRASATANELGIDELRAGGAELREKTARVAPRALAVLGAGAFRRAFSTKAAIGRQPELFQGAALFVLPNPSGLQASYQLPALVELFSELRPFVVGAPSTAPNGSVA